MVMETMRSLMNVLINEIGSGKHNPLGDQIKVTTKLKKLTLLTRFAHNRTPTN